MNCTSFTIAEILAGGAAAEVDLPPSQAQRQADAHFQSNFAALTKSQPDLARRIEQMPAPLEFVFGRDGALTARDDGGWWTGCSLPLATGRELLKTLDLAGVVGCFVHPTHAGQLRACFERIRPKQAIIAIVPDFLALSVILRCDDFSNPIEAARLLFAAGWDWDQRLAEIFQKHPGMPLPQQFIRTALLEDEHLQKFTTDAQAIVSLETARRGERVAMMRSRAQRRNTNTGRWVVAAGSQFKLGDMAGLALSATLGNASNVTVLDPDDPRQASPLAIAAVAADADAVVVADVFRSDMPDLLAQRIAWITWVTKTRLAPPDPNAPGDGIIVADPRWAIPARDAGWAAHRIEVGGWPGLGPKSAPGGRGKVKLLGLVADTFALDVPTQVKQFSSHALLWEMIADELTANPLSLAAQPREYLRRQMAKLDVKDEGFDQSSFLDRLIYPAYHQGLAGLALRAGLPLALLGRGWLEIPEFAPYACGPISGLEPLFIALSDCGALIHPLPEMMAHPIYTLGLPIVQPAGLTSARLVQAASRALRGKSPPARPPTPVLTKDLIQTMLGRLTPAL